MQESDGCQFTLLKPLCVELAIMLIILRLNIPQTTACQRHIASVCGHTELGQPSQRRCRQGSSDRPRGCVISPDDNANCADCGFISGYRKKVRRLVRRSAEEAFD